MDEGDPRAPRRPAAAARSAARRAGDRVPVAGLAGAGVDSVRRDANLLDRASIGRPRAVRAVARACATNPVALAIPCHRVVPAAGGEGGYRWGAGRKKALLKSGSQKCEERRRRPMTAVGRRSASGSPSSTGRASRRRSRRRDLRPCRRCSIPTSVRRWRPCILRQAIPKPHRHVALPFRHRGVTKKFAAPLPATVQALREELYARLAPIANRWSGRLGRNRNRPATRNPQSTFPSRSLISSRTSRRGQIRPTPLLLSYTAAATTACTGRLRRRCVSTAGRFALTATGSTPGAGSFFW